MSSLHHFILFDFYFEYALNVKLKISKLSLYPKTKSQVLTVGTVGHFNNILLYLKMNKI